MKYIFKKLSLLFAIGLLLIVSCSKEDEGEGQGTNIEIAGGEVQRSQVTTLNLTGKELTENEYQGTLDGVPITLTKSGEDKLLFMMPYSTSVGGHNLNIPALNTSVSYNVKNTELSETPEVTLEPFFVNLNSFSQSLDASEEGVKVKATLDNFKEYYNKASVDEKTEMAIIYKANKTQIDEVFSGSYSDNKLSKKNGLFGDVLKLVAHHTAEVAVMAVGCVVIVAGAPVFGAAIAAAGAYKAYKANGEAIDVIAGTIKAEFIEKLGINQKRAAVNEVLSLANEKPNQVGFNVFRRDIIAADEKNTGSIAKQYFEAFNQYNYYAKKDNIEIEKVNSKKGTKYSLISSEVLPQSNPEVKTAVDSETFEKVKFSISHPNLTLVSTSFQSDGQMTINVKITGTPSSLPVESFLNYSYDDNFSKLTGKIAISVDNSLVGTWKLESSYDGSLPVGQSEIIYDGNCPDIITRMYTLLEVVIIFDADSWTDSTRSKDVRLNKSINSLNCSIINDAPDDDETVSVSENGTYTYKNNIITWGDGGTSTLIFLSNNKIKIDSDIYVRQ